MPDSIGEERPLRATDSSDSENRNIVEIYVQDGDGQVRSMVASGRPCLTIDRCESHFIAYGVCVDCTRAAGKPVWAE